MMPKSFCSDAVAGYDLEKCQWSNPESKIK